MPELSAMSWTALICWRQISRETNPEHSRLQQEQRQSM